MRLNFIKVISAIVLVASVSTFTGLPSFAAPVEKAEETCCDDCDNGKAQDTDQCSTPFCPAFLCLSFNTVSLFSLSISEDSAYLHRVVTKTFSKPTARSVFHPPASI